MQLYTIQFYNRGFCIRYVSFLDTVPSYWTISTLCIGSRHYAGRRHPNPRRLCATPRAGRQASSLHLPRHTEWHSGPPWLLFTVNANSNRKCIAPAITRTNVDAFPRPGAQWPPLVASTFDSGATFCAFALAQPPALGLVHCIPLRNRFSSTLWAWIFWQHGRTQLFNMVILFYMVVYNSGQIKLFNKELIVLQLFVKLRS